MDVILSEKHKGQARGRVKILTVVGARPQFVKAAVVSRALLARGLDEVLVHTGQHYDAAMSDIFFKELGLPLPQHHLGIGGLSHGAMTGRMLEAIESLLLQEKPDWVLVYGDTNSTLAGALAAAKLGIPIAHVEAGMRSFNRAMPEEINRVLTDHLSSKLFVTSPEPVRLLAAEGIQQGVHCVGDVMYDAVRAFAPLAARTGLREHLQLAPGSYGLLTLHRAENTDDPARLRRWLSQLEVLSRELPLVFPVHPRTRQAILTAAPDWQADRIHLIEPVGYLEMLDLTQAASLILTDSGGLQKEALYLGVPCLTLRTETEWTETLEAGWNQLVPEPEPLAGVARACMAAPPLGPAPILYGDGTAAEQIAKLL